MHHDPLRALVHASPLRAASSLLRDVAGQLEANPLKDPSPCFLPRRFDEHPLKRGPDLEQLCLFRVHDTGLVEDRTFEEARVVDPNATGRRLPRGLDLDLNERRPARRHAGLVEEIKVEVRCDAVVDGRLILRRSNLGVANQRRVRRDGLIARRFALCVRRLDPQCICEERAVLRRYLCLQHFMKCALLVLNLPPLHRELAYAIVRHLIAANEAHGGLAPLRLELVVQHELFRVQLVVQVRIRLLHALAPHPNLRPHAPLRRRRAKPNVRTQLLPRPPPQIRFDFGAPHLIIAEVFKHWLDQHCTFNEDGRVLNVGGVRAHIRFHNVIESFLLFYFFILGKNSHSRDMSLFQSCRELIN